MLTLPTQQLMGSRYCLAFCSTFSQAMGVDHFALYDSDGSAAEIQQVFSVSADAQAGHSIAGRALDSLPQKL